MRPRDLGETDALVRRIRGYARVFENPPANFLSTRMRMEGLMSEAFLDLDKRLQAGEPLPRIWLPAVGIRVVEQDARESDIEAPPTGARSTRGREC